MEKAAGLERVGRRIEERYGVNRGLVLAVGLGCLALGGLSVVLPVSLYRSLVRIVGGLLLVSGGVKAGQLLLGIRSASTRELGWPVIASQVGLDLAMGFVLLFDWKQWAWLGAIALGLLFFLEGLLLLFMAYKSRSIRSGLALAACGLLTSAVGVVLAFGLVADPVRWLGMLVGVKLIAFGATLTWIAATSSKAEASLIYGAEAPEPEPGELYAVYFGTAFHLGVYLGDGRVVHFLNDNHVYEVSWEAFLDGRFPQHWTYPDIEPVPFEVIKATSLAEVGKTYPYHLLTFNCENFAVYCKSGGRVKTSRYAQIAGGFSTLELHPLVGVVAELNTRLVEWVAFHFGGQFGKRFSLTVRRVGALVTTWLVTNGRRKSAK